MKWKIEECGVHSNVLFDDGQRNVDSEPVAIGMPLALAQRMVVIHNEALDALEAKLKGPKVLEPKVATKPLEKPIKRKHPVGDGIEIVAKEKLDTKEDINIFEAQTWR